MNNNTSLGDMANITDGTTGQGQGQLITTVAMLSLFSVVGIIGNAIAFYIFWRRRTTSTSVIFILALAGTDFITCLVTIPYTLVFELLRYNLVYDAACKMYMFLVSSTVPFSAYIMVGIAIDRYFCICHPFLHAFNIPRAKVVIFFLGIPAVTFGVITALMHGQYRYNSTLWPKFSDMFNGSQLTSKELESLANQLLSREHPAYVPGSAIVIRGGHGDVAEYSNTTRIIKFVHIEQESVCFSNGVMFTKRFADVFEVVHACGFLVAFVSVAVLYILIYKSICTRRLNKARRKKNNLYPTSNQVHKPRISEVTMMTAIANGGGGGGGNGGCGCRGEAGLEADEGEEETPAEILNNKTSKKDGKPAQKIILTANNDPGACFNKTEVVTSGCSEDPGCNNLSVTHVDPAVAATIPALEAPEDEETASLLPPSEDGVYFVDAPGYRADRSGGSGGADEGAGGANDPGGTCNGDDDNGDRSSEKAIPTRDNNSAANGRALAGDSLPQTAADGHESARIIQDLLNENHTQEAETKKGNTAQEEMGNDGLEEEDEVEEVQENCNVALLVAENDNSTRHREKDTGANLHDDTPQEEKPLLPQNKSSSPSSAPTSAQCPPAPPTSLPLKPSFPSSNAPGQAKCKPSKQYVAPKHLQTDAQTNSIKRKRPSTVRDRHLMANIKTAFMLFIVTLVFTIAFLPSLLMAHKLIPFNIIVFYGYFFYNVANPFIYAFMNQTFREDLKKIMKLCSR